MSSNSRYKKIMAESEARYNKVMSDSETRYQTTMSAGNARYRGVMAEGNVRYKAMMMSGDARYNRVMAESDARYQSILPPSEQRTASIKKAQELSSVSQYAENIRPVSGHWIGKQPLLPSNTNRYRSSEQDLAVSEYLMDTHMNIQHPDMETFEKRAMAHKKWSPVEDTIIQDTKTALKNYKSPEFKLSSHMVHNERRVLADRADNIRTEQSKEVTELLKTQAPGSTHEMLTDMLTHGKQGPFPMEQSQSLEFHQMIHSKRGKLAERAHKLDAEVTKMTKTRAQGSGSAYESLTDMLIHGKQGPLTMEQSALGVESTIVGHHVLDKTSQYSEDNPRMQAIRAKDPETGRTSSAVNSQYGVDLSPDKGTALRDKLGLPVMMGTSGSSSDVVRSYKHTVEQIRKQDSGGAFMSLEEHHQPLKALTFNWMRAGAPAENVGKMISTNQTKHGQLKFTKPPSSATQTHTYPEIAAGIDLTLKGNTSENLRQSTVSSTKFMTQVKNRE